MKHKVGQFAVMALSAIVMLLASPALAAPDGRSQRLEALDDRERALLAPLLERGPVALVEFSQGDVLPAVLVAGYVESPAAQVAKVISNPKDYPKFMKTLDHVEMLSETPTQNAYKWTWQTGVLFLEGENRMTIMAPPKDKPELGYRISVKSERGQMGEGRILWRVFPVSAKRSMVTLSMRVDMRDANFVMRQLDAASRSVNRSVNIALAHVMLLGTKREAERQSGTTPKLPQSVPFEETKLDLEKLRALLDRADLLMMELTPTGLGKLSIVGRGGATPAQLTAVMLEPETFGKSLVPGSYTRITKREGEIKTFEWGVDLPLIGTSGTMKMKGSDGLVSIDSTDGALKGGRWRFRTPTLASGEGVVVGYSQFDVTKTTWLIEKIASLDPAMGHGLAAATQVMLLRALRKRVKQDQAEYAKLHPGAPQLTTTVSPAAAAPPSATPATAAPTTAAPATGTQAIAAPPGAAPASAVPAAPAPSAPPAPSAAPSASPPPPTPPAPTGAPAATAPAASKPPVARRAKLTTAPPRSQK